MPVPPYVNQALCQAGLCLSDPTSPFFISFRSCAPPSVRTGLQFACRRRAHLLTRRRKSVILSIVIQEAEDYFVKLAFRSDLFPSLVSEEGELPSNLTIRAFFIFAYFRCLFFFFVFFFFVFVFFFFKQLELVMLFRFSLRVFFFQRHFSFAEFRLFC